jgi:hypothetical protein
MNARIYGTTDQVHVCDCCQREGLKKTVKIDVGNGIAHYGTGCAARALREPEATVRKIAKAADDAAHEAAQKARAAAFALEYQTIQAALDARLPHLAGDRFRQRQALGPEYKTIADAALRAAGL